MSSSAVGTVGQLLQRSVLQWGDKEAIVTSHETLSYRELDRRTSTMARALIAHGAGKGTRIALLAPDGILWLTAFLAAMRIGAIVAPISTLCATPELLHILRHCDAQILIGVTRFLRHDYAQRLEEAIPSLHGAGQGSLYLTQVPYLRAIWLDDVSSAPWARSHETAFCLPDLAAPDIEVLRSLETEVVPSDEALIIYTSGSTSLPKAVLHTQRSLSEHSHVLAFYFRMKPSDRMMPLLPLFWVGGITIALEVLDTGGTLVYPESPATDIVVDTLKRYRVNRLNTWGPQLANLRAAAAKQGVDVESIVGLAAPRTAEGVLIEGNRLANLLGMTESFGPHSAERLDVALPEDRRGSSGRATGSYERRVVNPDTGAVLKPGESGELQLRGGALMKGFYKTDPREVFTADGYYATRDTVRILDDGHLFFEGRRGDMLKTGGANVSRLEVEAALRTLAEVEQAFVVGLPDATAGQIVVAAVVPAAGKSPTEEALQTALRRIVSSYKVPRRIVFLNAGELMWTPSNKIKLAEMANLIAARIGSSM